MSSSNRVRITAIEETVYGETPVAGNFDTVRMTSDSLSGTPETTESQQLRADRQSSGQIVTGLTVSGTLNGELAKEDTLDLFIESAMYSVFATTGSVAADLTIATGAGTITRAAGDFNTDVAIGDVVILTGFTNAVNNTEIMVTAINSAVEISFVGPSTIVDEVDTGNTLQVADKIETGLIKKSFSMQKEFQDLTDKAIIYKGQIASSMNMTIAYGEIVNYAFEFSGNGYEAVDAAANFITDGRTVNPAATTSSMNGSIDMSFIASDSGGTFDALTFCIQSVEIALNNNLTPQNCIGLAAPKDYSEGEATIGITLTAYLEDENWNLLSKKLTQDPFSIGFIIKNAGGFYGFYMPAIQVTGEDPAAAGKNQDIILTMTGQAKIGGNGENQFRMFKG